MYAEKLKSSVRFFKESVVDNSAIDFWLQQANTLWSVDQSLGKIIEKQTVAKDTVSLKIKVNRHFEMGYAGQHHPVFIEIDGRCYERTYSLTQLDQSHVQLTAKKVTAGKVSTWLFEQAKKGDIIRFGQPYGDMHSAAESDEVVLLAAGSGITPMFSLLQHWSSHKHVLAKPVTLLYWVKTVEDAAFKTELLQLTEKLPKFTCKILYTQAENPDARINQSDVEAITHLKQSRVYACGPSGFIAKVEELFASAKILRTEAFSLSPVNNTTSGFVQVTLTQSNRVLNIPKGQAILPSLEQQGVKPTFGCRMGVCNKCVCNKGQGSTKNLINGLENTEPNSQLKICVNSAQSDLSIDL